ncbi:iron dependent repressor, metal binding and dimerization domain protein [Butyrivibrio sp. YAB3001]|uniref:iron dependent repressor, metal binding and dimerization domain protein n=1 Tax=Butyrivibrio sp. YAB3001 TaxID=1520812 RepID=UPI000B896357|nr:iron dependent repressor, metal binding and dimerization domain protein [Butyrivibrio sp. YAB3001]
MLTLFSIMLPYFFCLISYSYSAGSIAPFIKELQYQLNAVLTRLFINLGVNEKTASDDACRIEHYISDESFKAIKKHMAQFC